MPRTKASRLLVSEQVIGSVLVVIVIITRTSENAGIVVLLMKNTPRWREYENDWALEDGNIFLVCKKGIVQEH